MELERFEDFSRLISGIYRDIQRLKTAYVDGENMGVKSVHTLWVYLLLRYPEGLYASELAEKSMSSRSLVSREINELIEKELICEKAGNSLRVPEGREPQKEEGRRYGTRFVLTEKGLELAGKVQRIVASVQADADKGISEKELERFYQVLTALKKNFDEIVRERVARTAGTEEEETEG